MKAPPPVYRPVLLAVALSLAAVSLGAQTPPADPLPVIPSSNPGRPACDADGLDAATFGAMIDRRFSALVSPATEGIPGNFLAVEIKEAQASAAQSFVSGGGQVLTVSVRGGVTDGVVAILQDASLTPKFGATAQAHFLGPAKRKLQFLASACRALDSAVVRAQAAHAVRVAEIRANASSVQRRVDSTALAVKAAKIDSVLKTIAKPPGSARDSIRRDSLVVDSMRVAAQRQWLDSLSVPRRTTELLAANNALGRAYQEARKLIEVQGFSLDWWSIGFSFDNASFNLFDPAAALAAQVSKRTDVTHALTATYSRITQSTFDYESRYLALGARFGWENNLAELTKVELTDRQQFAPPPAERVSEKKTTAYQGELRDDVHTVRLSVDYYEFFVKDDRLAVHLFPAFSAKSRQIGEVSFGIGILLSARNAAKKASVANAELFFNAPDLANVRHSDKSPWQRGVLGLRLTFPINFAPGS